VEEQEGEERPFSRCSELEATIAVEDFEWSQHPELHSATVLRVAAALYRAFGPRLPPPPILSTTSAKTADTKEGAEMIVRTAFLGAAVLVALAVVSVVQAASPGDAHDRQAVVATLQDTHDRAVLPGSNVGTLARDAHDRLPVPQPPTVVGSQNGFDWGDAALGAASGIGLVLLVAGLAFLVVSPRAGTRVATR
jgi:hypothetical protein